MNILMTGGTGFVGRAMLDAAPEGCEVTVLSRQTGVDLDKPETVWGLRRCDYILHLAGSEDFSQIVTWARLMTAVAESMGATLLLTSSGAAAGMTNDYGAGKRRAERIIGAYTGGRIARLYSFIGPYMSLDSGKAVTDFLSARLAGKPLIVKGDGNAVRSYMYQTDLAAWLWAILLRGKPGQVYNVGSERAVTVAELARMVAGDLPVEIQGGANTGLAPDVYVPDTSATRQELGLAETVALEEQIRRTLEFHRNSANSA